MPMQPKNKTKPQTQPKAPHNHFVNQAKLSNWYCKELVSQRNVYKMRVRAVYLKQQEEDSQSEAGFQEMLTSFINVGLEFCSGSKE